MRISTERIRRQSSSCYFTALIMLIAWAIRPVSAFGNQKTIKSHLSPTAKIRARSNQVTLWANQEFNQVPWINEVDVHHNVKTPLQYDPEQERFVTAKTRERSKASSLLRPILSSAFIPDGVNDSYFKYMQWRFLQRFCNANLHVIGTQSLLLGLGIESSRLGVGAALNWVLKDALGKMTRMLWASRMGRRFDSDAKRWRFRASLLFAFGNYLEIVTYMMPQLFLLWATLANCFKQIAMLTSSSTRTSLYNSFRDGTRENIGDITAKGEAQIAVVDLLGIVSGVALSRLVGTAIHRVLLSYIGLQVLEIFCMYHEIRFVQFRVLNFERLVQIIQNYVRSQPPHHSLVTNAESNIISNLSSSIPTPEEMSQTERIFFPPKHLSRRALAFGSLGRAKLSEKELRRLLEIFGKERFLLIVGRNVKHRKEGHSKKKNALKEHCHIVLHEDASNADIVKSTLALTILREKIFQLDKKQDFDNLDNIRSRHCWDLLEDSCKEADRLFPKFLRELSNRKWASPSRFMFGRVHMRAQWPLKHTTSGKESPPTSSKKKMNN